MSVVPHLMAQWKLTEAANERLQAELADAKRQAYYETLVAQAEIDENKRLTAELEALRTERDEARRTMREAHEAGTTLAAELEALRADAAIGQLVRRKLVSGNSVPVERCHITAAEVAALEARKGAA